MRKLVDKFSVVEKQLPLLVKLTEPTTAYYKSPLTGIEKKVKAPKGATFSILGASDKTNLQEEDVIVNTDLVILKGITAGDSGRVYAKFKYSDLVKNAILDSVTSTTKKQETKSLLLFGLPRKYFFIGVGGLLILAGLYLRKKK